MAINLDEMVELYYEGDAQYFVWPVWPIADFQDLYVPLKEMPASVQELFTYNPDKAKELLAEAGHPSGLTAEVVVNTERHIDLLSIVKAYWEKVGINLVIKPVDTAVFEAMRAAKSYPQGVMDSLTAGWAFRPANIIKDHHRNLANAVVPLADELLAKSFALLDKPGTRAQLAEMWKPVYPQFIDLVPGIELPQEKVFASVWQPWVKNYHGEQNAGDTDAFSFLWYIWIDQELKEAMGR